MTIKLEKQTIEIFKALKKKKSDEISASEFADDLGIDYIVLMSAINELKKYDLADFKEIEIFQVSLNEEGRSYLK
ncbi:MAG: hypothetical protein R6W84_15915, partial [Promethearchaeia archaeon]